MLLNEIKQIFELDQDIVNDVVNGLGIRVGKNYDDNNKKPGDVDLSLKQVVQDCIVTTTPANISKKQIQELMGDPDKAHKTNQSLANLLGTLDAFEKSFKDKIEQELKNELKSITGPTSLTTNQYLNSLISGMDNAAKYDTAKTDAANDINSKRDQLVRTIMQYSQAQSFGQQTFDELKNFFASQLWSSDNGVTALPAGIIEARQRIQRFFNIVAVLRHNTKVIATKLAANTPSSAS